MDIKIGQTKGVKIASTPANVKFDGIPEWTSSDEAVATVAAAPDGLTARITGVGPGTAQIRARVDADLDADEVRELFGDLEVVVKADEAETITIEPDPTGDEPEA
jgi:uncharacterized protein YjdB